MIIQRLNIRNFNFYKFNVIRSYVPVDEFCNIINNFINKDENGKTYNISNDKLIFKFNEIIKILKFFINQILKLKEIILYLKLKYLQ